MAVTALSQHSTQASTSVLSQPGVQSSASPSTSTSAAASPQSVGPSSKSKPIPLRRSTRSKASQAEDSNSNESLDDPPRWATDADDSAPPAIGGSQGSRGEARPASKTAAQKQLEEEEYERLQREEEEELARFAIKPRGLTARHVPGKGKG